MAAVNPRLLIRPLKSLKIKIIAAAVGILFTAMWLLTYYTSHGLRRDMERQIAEQQFASVSYIASAISDNINAQFIGLSRVASKIDQRMMDDPAALQELLENRPLFQDLFNGGVMVTSRDGTAIADFPPNSG